jgi:acyl-CoA synthetase (AMP-forming)/AMP-acid ligase II
MYNSNVVPNVSQVCISQVWRTSATKTFMNLADMLANAAKTSPDAPALALGDAVISTYAEHADRSARLAGGLTATTAGAPGSWPATA